VAASSTTAKPLDVEGVTVAPDRVLDFDVGREHEYFRTVSTSAVVSNSSADANGFSTAMSATREN
jgi:hypothetical protein